MGLLDSFKKLFKSGPPKDPRKKLDISKRFEIRGRSGQGSMSKVFQAYDNEIGRTVCLKLLDKQKTAKFEEKFKIQGLKKPPEGEICMALRHHNIVTTYDHGLGLTGEPFLSMEWIEGRGLNYLLEAKSPDLTGNRINYLCQLCDAISYLHNQKYLHRDLCPRNIMVNTEGVVKLIDFGLTLPYTPEFCRPGNRTGTADYLAPEIIKRMTTDHRVDLFALGVTAFELFTGQLPWEKTLSSEETLRRHLNTPAREPKDLNPDLDDALAAILHKAISKDSRERFPTARSFKQALEDLDRKDY